LVVREDKGNAVGSDVGEGMQVSDHCEGLVSRGRGRAGGRGDWEPAQEPGWNGQRRKQAMREHGNPYALLPPARTPVHHDDDVRSSRIFGTLGAENHTGSRDRFQHGRPEAKFPVSGRRNRERMARSGGSVERTERGEEKGRA